MKKAYLGSAIVCVGLSLVLFQNCSSGSLPSAVSGANSAASVAAQQCVMDNISYVSGTVETGYGQATADGTTCPAAMTLTCTDGLWYGTSTASGSTGITTGGDGTGSTVSYTTAYANCTAVNQPCSAAGTTINSGSTLVAYTASTVPNGSSCSTVQATLSCTNGTVTASNGSAASAFVSATCAVQAFAGNYTYVGQITTGSYQDPSIYGYKACPSGSNGGSCSTKGSHCFFDYGGYYDGYNSFNLYTCK